MTETSLSENLVKFIPRLLTIADKQISKNLTNKFDADDVVASVCRSVMRRHQDGRFRFADNEELWKLVVIALKRKVFNKVRGEKTAKRDYTKSSSLDDNEFVAAVSKEPDPLDLTSFAELLSNVEARVDDVCREVLECKLAGMNNREIAKKLSVTERTIGRKLLILKDVISDFIDLPE